MNNVKKDLKRALLLFLASLIVVFAADDIFQNQACTYDLALGLEVGYYCELVILITGYVLAAFFILKFSISYYRAIKLVYSAKTRNFFIISTLILTVFYIYFFCNTYFYEEVSFVPDFSFRIIEDLIPYILLPMYIIIFGSMGLSAYKRENLENIN